MLGVLPLGTSNDFARSLGIPVDPCRAVVLLARGKVAAIDLGRFAYLLAAAYAMRRRPAFGCELRYAGTTEELALTQLSVTNAPVLGGPLQLSVPASSPDDRLLDMLAIEPVTPGRMLASGTAMLLGARRPVPGIRVWHAPRLYVNTDEELEVTLDGEICGALPGDFEVAGNALRITPARLRRHRRLTPASTSAKATGACPQDRAGGVDADRRRAVGYRRRPGRRGGVCPAVGRCVPERSARRGPPRI